MLAVLESRLQICVSCILSPTLAADVAQVALSGVVGVEILDVDPLRPADLLRGIDEAIFGDGNVESALGHLNRPVGAMGLLVPWSLVCFELRKMMFSFMFLKIRTYSLSKNRTFFMYGIRSLADQPCVFHESKSSL